MSKLEEEMAIYYETINERPDIGWFLQGHIVVQHMLRNRLSEIAPKSFKKLKRNSTFHEVLIEAHKFHIVSDEQNEVLTTLNRIRNKYAHRLSYRPSLEELISLWESAKQAFCDMTDGIEQGLAELKSVESLEEADRFHLNELFVQICHDLLQKAQQDH